MKISNVAIIRHAILTLALVAVVIMAVGCSDGNTQTKSMEQIYAEEGVPVRLQTVEPQRFVSDADFTAVLTGIEESSAYARVADRVVRITAHVGDFVAKDSVIVILPSDNPSAQYHQAKIQYENAAATFSRMQQYYKAGGLSQQEFDNADAAFRVAAANWDAVRQSVQVRAPISGVISRLNVRESDNVQKDDELLTVSRTDRLKATVWVPDADIQSLAVGLPARALWNGTELTGRVVQVDRSVNRQHQAFGVVVELDNPGKKFRSGVTATISIDVYHNDSALVTERKNVMNDHAGDYVFVAHEDRAEKRYVTLGQSSLLDVEIVDGLKPGDRLVTEGQLNLEDGTLLKVVGDTSTSAVAIADGR